MSRHNRNRTRLRRLGGGAGILVLLLMSTVGGGSAVGANTQPSQRQAAAPSLAYDATKTLSRTHLISGADKQVDQRKVTVTVDTTTGLKDRQSVNVNWRGAHPTGGVYADRNSALAATEEYPVVVMQCRGVDSATAPASKRISPQTCWTQTPDERFQYSDFVYPSYRMDRYAVTADRGPNVNQPNPLPAKCPDLSATHWVPFKASDGTVYPGGRLGCGGLAPEAANAADSSQPGSTTYGVADRDGVGTAKFVMQNSDSNASLGCSATVACTLVVIPIMGVSCDATGTAAGPGLGMEPDQRPDIFTASLAYDECSKKGQFAPGDPGSSGNPPDLAVSGQLWWSASNWRNRFSVPLSFAPSASACSLNGGDGNDSAYVYGSENLLQATQQWGPYLCTRKNGYTLRHVQTSEPQAKNLLNVGSVPAAFQARPPSTPFTKPTVQAPTALSGWAIGFSVDGRNGRATSTLKLDGRLIAKLLSESYPGCVGCLDFDSKAAHASGFSKLRNNPYDISRDPEFRALNPDVGPTSNIQAASTLEFMSSDADTMTALTSYLDADPEAREWLNGVPDPWGMVVNPAYQNIALPVTNWPLLDTTIANPGSNQCLVADPVPWLPLVASPVSNPATVSLHLQFDIANSQINCANNGDVNQKLTGLGRQAPGDRFVLGLVAYSDAAQYQINTAQLQTQRTSTGNGEFDDDAGRSFAAPSTATIATAAKLMTANDAKGTWTQSYDTLRGPAGTKAYPGTLLISTDVPTSGLDKGDAANYASFLRFAAGRGQDPGRGIGDLPEGYVPLSGKNGLRAFSSYTETAAAAVGAQNGTVPNVSGKPLPSSAGADSGGGTGGSPAGGGGGAPANGSASGAGAGAGAGNPAAPSTGNATSPTTTPPSQSQSPTSVNAAPVGKTSAIGSGFAALVLPLAALAALVALGSAIWSSGMGRR